METVRLKTHIGSDGILKVEAPVGVADVVLVYTVQPTPVAASMVRYGRP